MSEIDRRKFLTAGAASMGTLGLMQAMPAWATGHANGTLARRGSDVLAGEHLTMTVADAAFRTGKRYGPAVTVNGTLPGPLVRLKEGQNLVVDLVNHSSGGTSVHWHGLLVPFLMDGVPGVTMAAVKPGETFRYEFPIRQSGTYWWHAHTLQEPMGHYGPIVIDPLEPDPFTWDREYVLMLSDWSPMHPMTVMKKLRTQADYFNYHRTTATDDYALSGAERRMWAKMRMSPTDIADIGGWTYTYLINGHGPDDGLELPFTPGERLRLRIINGSAMTFFNIRVPGLPMTVVAADGQNVNPVETDEFQIGVAETYDVLITPQNADAFAFVAESIDRSGMGVAMLASRPGARASVPALRKPPVLTMADMGMAMNAGAMAGMDHGAMDGMDMSGMDMGTGKGNTGSGMNMRDTARLPASVKAGPGMDMVAMHPADRMDFPGLGLDQAGHRVLTYKQLTAARTNPDLRRPSRLKEIHLTGNMERYMWSFDGQKFDAVTDKPIRFAFNERVRVRLVNDTMMVHPIHLHGHFFELVNGAPSDRQPRKHTVNVQPGGSATFDLTADTPGDWPFHCHLFYHMHQGMFQIVTVRPLQEGAGQ
ncbi:copper resistance system multicopper oxidase [Novosphingobium album (ex Hu et al. 2023)]|uniref:Copper resistance system multicopper oxidase n=1 Tax=Novosphingobium album (ex Hu et al. 2023) TaxID=2930093 RepID=A0ABT0B060_9SPHN|nr:copper resistance system multicopper oxidase [Novosphingobium album (ex Hu et al. 2023)]MCJ2178405.1 copper resistance system multicopper oxidase [Novosphingobium album (ex Hu et al. 2023)]